MRLLVCGSRTYADSWQMREALDQINKRLPVHLLIHGAARGADMLAHRWGRKNDILIRPFPAKWALGRRAGIERNGRMLRDGHPEMVVGFVDKPLTDSRGTLDMIHRSAVAGLPVFVFGDYSWLTADPDGSLASAVAQFRRVVKQL